jgi:hypothetical protein
MPDNTESSVSEDRMRQIATETTMQLLSDPAVVYELPLVKPLIDLLADTNRYKVDMPLSGESWVEIHIRWDALPASVRDYIEGQT